jgi:hypothetical protein
MGITAAVSSGMSAKKLEQQNRLPVEAVRRS